MTQPHLPCNNELWLAYCQVSRANKSPTTQLIELEFQNHKFTDLEEVLEHVFRQGYIDTKYRSATWWERQDGTKVRASRSVEELLKQGIGKCQETALRLIIADMPPALWFSYAYVSNPNGHIVTQRIKFDGPQTRLERLAHVTNYIFNQGYLPAKVRSFVHWQRHCGKRIDECARLDEVLASGDGVSEDQPLHLVIDNSSTHCRCCNCH